MFYFYGCGGGHNLKANSIGALYNKLWNEEKSKHINFTQQTCFGPALLHRRLLLLLTLAKGTTKPNIYAHLL
jgi:hypothetical protein